MSVLFGRQPPVCPPSDSDIVVPLIRPPLWRRTLTWTSTMTLALLASSVADVGPKLWAGEPVEPESLVWAALVAAWFALLAIDFLRRKWVRRWPMPPITFRQHTMSVPTHGEARLPLWFRYTDLVALGESGRLAVGVGGSRPKAQLVRHFFLETHRSVISIDERWFADAQGPDRFFRALRQRLNEETGVSEQLLQTEHMRRPAMDAMGRYPAACQMLIGIMAVFFLNTWLKGALQTPFGLLRWGAMAPALAYRWSEAYRFVSANFLHGHWLHVAMNMWALSYLGNMIEQLLGKSRFLVLFVCSALAAMIASAYSAGALLSVGASGAIFGLLGAFAVLSRRLRRALPLGLRQPPRWWLSLLAINTVLPLLWPVIDWSAHVAGFSVGAILTLAMIGRRQTLPPAAGRVGQVMAGLCVCLCVAGLSMAVTRAAQANAAQETKLADVLLHDRHTTAFALNNLAWLWALDREANEEHLEAGTRCAQEAVEREPGVPEFHVTLASLWERRGDFTSARAQWAEATETTLTQAHQDDDFDMQPLVPARAWQIARSYLAMAPAARPQLMTVTLSSSSIDLDLSPNADARRPLAIYLAAFDGTKAPVGVVRLALVPGTTHVRLPPPLERILRDAHTQTVEGVHVHSLPTSADPLAHSDHTFDGIGWTVWRPTRLLPSLSP